MVNIPEILANLVFGTIFVWFVVMLILPKSIFDLVEEQKLPKTVLEHFLYIASIGYFEDNHGKFWKQLSPPDKRSQAASQHQRYIAGQRMITNMYFGYAVASTLAMAYVLNAQSLQGAVTWAPLFVAFLAVSTIWALQVRYARQVATWNTDLAAAIRIHTAREMQLFKFRAFLLAIASLIFMFS